jgi:hypothetical protein
MNKLTRLDPGPEPLESIWKTGRSGCVDSRIIKVVYVMSDR